MSHAVNQYRITDIQDIITVKLPVGAAPLHFDFQRADLYLWAVADTTEAKIKPLRFRMAGAGHPLDVSLDLQYVNTAFLHEMQQVYHFFRILDR
jgi:hypothetical protein